MPRGVFCVTNYWEHFSPERELAQARNMAQAAKAAKVPHVIWSTLEDTRKWVPLSDNRMPTLMGKYKVPHFDAKGEADQIFARSRRADDLAPDVVLLGQLHPLRFRARARGRTAPWRSPSRSTTRRCRASRSTTSASARTASSSAAASSSARRSASPASTCPVRRWRPGLTKGARARRALQRRAA